MGPEQVEWETLPTPTVIPETINQEFFCVELQDGTCISGFIVDDQADASSEETPWPKGLMRFLNEYKGKF